MAKVKKGDKEPKIEFDVREHELGDDDAPLAHLFGVKLKHSDYVYLK